MVLFRQFPSSGNQANGLPDWPVGNPGTVESIFRMTVAARDFLSIVEVT
jgi:hypothetical protein